MTTDTTATVLIVDDESIMRIMLQDILEKAGYHTVCAADGMGALRGIEEHRPDLVLLDVMLPDISGYDVFTRIKENPDHKTTPVIFITALNEEKILDDCSKLGQGVDYILKPLRADILLARVSSILTVVETRKQLALQNRKLQAEMAERGRLAAVIEQFTDSVLVMDSCGKIIYANQACEKNSGYPPQELMGQQIWQIQHVATEKEKIRYVLDTILAGKEWQGTVHNVKKNGSHYLEEISIQPVRNDEGLVSGYVMIKKDITERRRLESIASSVNLMDNVGFVFSGIRHELGNPVNSLKMTLSVLAKKIGEFPPEKVLDFLERSQHEISRIEYLLKSLRSFSMFERPVSNSIDLVLFLKRVSEMHRKELAKKQIRFDVKVEKDACCCYADERALLQVMLNLLTNAANALENREDPEIKIHVFLESPSLVCLSIRDNGCGISLKDQELLFKPFFTTRPEGTGLGLVIVKKMLAQMNCSIHLNSRENEGSVFSLLLPVREEVAD